MINLDNCTLVCIDCIHPHKGLLAIWECMRHVNFKAVKLLTNHTLVLDACQVVRINKIETKEQYSDFVFRLLHHHFDTELVMICQWDGYIINPAAWREEFTQYDYIGAPWWYTDGYNVGNGGFSIRTRRLQKTLSTLKVSLTHPEDDCIGREYRETLERDYGMKFAPEGLAMDFSWEGNPRHPQYKRSFGFHGGKPQL